MDIRHQKNTFPTWKWVGGFSSSAASFGPTEYFSCAWEKPSLPTCLLVFCFLWVRPQPGEVPAPLVPFSSWPMGLVQKGEQLAPFSLEGKGKAAQGTSLLLFCLPACSLWSQALISDVWPPMEVTCRHTQRPGKVRKGSATLQVKITPKIVRTAEVDQQVAWESSTEEKWYCVRLC